MIALGIERNTGHTPERLIFKIGDAGVDLEIFEHAQHLQRIARDDREGDAGMSFLKGRGDARKHGEGRRNGGETNVAGKTAPRRAHFLSHGAGIADDAPRPLEHALPLRRQPLKPRPALHEHDAELILQLADGGRERRLRNPAFLRSAAEMLFIGKGDEEFQLVDHPVSRPGMISSGSSPSSAQPPRDPTCLTVFDSRKKIEQRFEEGRHAEIADAVINQPALTARVDQPFEPQTRELLRDHCLLYAENILDFTHRPLLIREDAEDQKSGLMRQRLQ
ncbi:hypothetical protein RHECNPAF_7500102 [Rhizobium etli CNPAF512]|nr:hypothetical protein RHECNPAF_7500102 [Rhizobium etli CNPAF512]